MLNFQFIFHNTIKEYNFTTFIWIFLVCVCVLFSFILHIAFLKISLIILNLCFSLSIYWLCTVCSTPIKTLHFSLTNFSIYLNQHGLFSDFVVTISGRIDSERIVYETTFTKNKMNAT